MSAYMLWLNSAREQIKADNPGLKVTEIAKKGGEIWRSMKDKSVCIFSIIKSFNILFINSYFIFTKFFLCMCPGVGGEGR